MKALANEIAKNLVLAGIGSLTVIDHESVKEEDLFAQFFVVEDDVGKNVRIMAIHRLSREDINQMNVDDICNSELKQLLHEYESLIREYLLTWILRALWRKRQNSTLLTI